MPTSSPSFRPALEAGFSWGHGPDGNARVLASILLGHPADDNDVEPAVAFAVVGAKAGERSD